MDLGIKGKRALVLGSTKGLGRGIVDALAEEGAIVALTGRVGADEKQECIDAGCTDYLAKPVPAKELLKRLTEFLAS